MIIVVRIRNIVYIADNILYYFRRTPTRGTFSPPLVAEEMPEPSLSRRRQAGAVWGKLVRVCGV